MSALEKVPSAVAGEEADVPEKDGWGLAPYFVSPSAGLDRLPGPGERTDDDRFG